MAKFADTSPSKRRLVWDPESRRLVDPAARPTGRQLRFLRVLCARAGVEFVRPGTVGEAHEQIRALRDGEADRLDAEWAARAA